MNKLFNQDHEVNSLEPNFILSYQIIIKVKIELQLLYLIKRDLVEFNQIKGRPLNLKIKIKK